MARNESISTARTPLPEGTVPVAIGLFIAGICSFAFFKVGVVALGSKEAFKPVVSMWFATFALAPGLFLPLEQELGRALSARRALGQGGRAVLLKVLTLGTVLAGMAVIALIAVGPWLANDYFGGNWVMVAALALSIVCYAPTHLSKGICSGSGRFRSYAVVLGADGVVRILFCLLLAAIGVTAVGWYGMAVAVAPLVGVIAVGAKGQLRTDVGPPADWKEVTPNLGWLLLGSLMAAGLVNAGPIATSLLADDNDALVTNFAYGVILARIPLFLFQAVQAALLPRLSRLAAAGEMTEFRVGFRKLLNVVIGVGVLGTVGAWVLGPLAVRIMYNGAELSRRTLAVLALGSAFYMLGLAISQAVLALHGHAQVALGWSVGMVSFIVTTSLMNGEVFRRVELGLLAGSLAAMVVFALALRSRLRAGAVPDAESLLVALTDMPFES